MEIKLGDTIANLRRQKGLTQEQLANTVGVSTPAVSKWETNSSYPDITMLAPIARALGTNVDTLLSFTSKLTDEQSAAFVSEVASMAQKEGGEAALKRMKEILCTYPENPMLQFQMAAVLIGFPTQSDAEKEPNRQYAKKMIEAVMESGSAQLFSQAVYLLAALCLEDNELDRAEELLARMPAPPPDAQLMKAALYERRGNMKEAKLTVQTSLYLALQKVETCLGKLISRNYVSETGAALHICEIHRQIAVLMDYPYAMSDILFAEVYLHDGNLEAASARILSLAESLRGEVKAWGDELFSELEMSAGQMSETLHFMRKMVYDSLKTDKMFEPLRENAKYQKAIDMLLS